MTTAPSDDLLQLEDVKVWFPIKEGIVFERHLGDVRAVDGVSFAIRRGETLGLVGESGCGKSTTGRAIIRLHKPTEGRIVFDGADITDMSGSPLRAIRRRMQMIFQDPYASLNPRMNVATIITEPAFDRRVEPGVRRSLPARVLRRSAPAHRRGPGPRPEPGSRGRRRADQRPRRVDPGPDHQPDGAVAE
jgi:ABC-type microcin C transport system duplicated ATPase subunit YejF